MIIRSHELAPLGSAFWQGVYATCRALGLTDAQKEALFDKMFVRQFYFVTKSRADPGAGEMTSAVLRIGRLKEDRRNVEAYCNTQRGGFIKWVKLPKTKPQKKRSGTT